MVDGASGADLLGRHVVRRAHLLAGHRERELVGARVEQARRFAILAMDFVKRVLEQRLDAVQALLAREDVREELS